MISTANIQNKSHLQVPKTRSRGFDETRGGFIVSFLCLFAYLFPIFAPQTNNAFRNKQ